uniref:Uncharacterized protein n=1 Tax=Arundo donax TaxID=35708 RepID=A0A0A9D197_ARUDO
MARPATLIPAVSPLLMYAAVIRPKILLRKNQGSTYVMVTRFMSIQASGCLFLSHQ